MMKLLVILLSATFINHANACLSPIEKSSVYELKTVQSEVLEVQTGDLIKLPFSSAMSPSFFESFLKKSYDKAVLSYLFKTNLPQELGGKFPMGVLRKTLYFKVIGAGSTDLKVDMVSSSGKVIQSKSLKLKATQKPVYRCM
ncbi:MAG: hypothetical protein HOE90_12095 [Bacteriovoracaceae bacterium]|jgi:hypothetical protein|nr:hypothetical protein [Bacteriovoracaceae bacterium]